MMNGEEGPDPARIGAFVFVFGFGHYFAVV